MKKDNRTKLCGALLITCGAVTMIWTALRIGGDNLARPDTKAPVSEKQAIIKEFFPTNKKMLPWDFSGRLL